MSDEDDDFFGEDDEDLGDIESVLSKKDQSERRRLLRERIELREIARQLEMDTDDWREAFPDI